MKATKQHKTPSRKERAVSPSTPLDEWAEPAQAPGAESGNRVTLETELTSSNESAPSPELGLVICPQCSQRALFWNRHDRIYKCVNPECKQKFTLEEYRNKEAQRLSAKQQTEQMSLSDSMAEAADKMESGATEQIPSNEPVTEVKDEIEPGATEQMPSNEPITEVKDEKGPGATEQMPSNESITEAANNKVELGATEQMPSSVPTAEVKDEIESGKIEETSSDVPATKTRTEVKEGAKAGKQMNRNLAFLLIGVLAIGIVVLGVVLGQKSGNLNELSSQLNKSRQALTQSQTQLAASQQDVEGLKTQLAQTQQEVEALQAQINELKPLTPSGPFVYSGELAGGDQISIPIELQQSERVEGTIAGGLGGLTVYIQDPGGGIAEDLGQVFRSSFTFTAPTSGTYAMIITGPSGVASSYIVNFTIYQRQ